VRVVAAGRHNKGGVAFFAVMFTAVGSSELGTHSMCRRTLYQWAKIQGLSFRQYAILKELISFTDVETYEAWTTVATLAEETMSRERTVQYALCYFRENDIIAETGRTHRTARGGNAPIYRVAPLLKPGSKGAKLITSPHALHPQGCSSVHQQSRHFETTSSKIGISLSPAADLPVELIREFVSRHGPGRYGDYVKPAQVDFANGRLVTRTNTARDWLRRDARQIFLKHKLSIISMEDLARG
jgi:hypothetical protein